MPFKDGKISEIKIDPNALDVNADNFKNLVGDDAKFNADKMIKIFKGEDNDSISIRTLILFFARVEEHGQPLYDLINNGKVDNRHVFFVHME